MSELKLAARRYVSRVGITAAKKKALNLRQISDDLKGISADVSANNLSGDETLSSAVAKLEDAITTIEKYANGMGDMDKGAYRTIRAKTRIKELIEQERRLKLITMKLNNMVDNQNK